MATYPKKLGNVTKEDIVYYLEEQLGGAIEDAQVMLAAEDIPEDDGTYVLTCTVTDGEATFSWESTSE